MSEEIAVIVEHDEEEPARGQSVTLFGTDNPAEVIERAAAVATGLADVVKKQGLVSVISGKEYPRVEAWTLLGTMLGVFPVVVWSREVGDGLGWEARVEARTLAGQVVGAAEAECLRSERTWAKRDSYALRSMAQTRATSKALRGPLGFVMTIAGFEATPEAEMPVVEVPAVLPETVAKSWAEWEKRMTALEVRDPMEWLRNAAHAAGLADTPSKAWGKALSQKANRVLLALADTEPASVLGFWSNEEIQSAFALAFDGVVVEPPPAPVPSDKPGQYVEDEQIEFGD